MTLVGYARVSSLGQSLDVQLDKLRAAGCDDKFIYQEKRSGVDTNRPELKICLDYVRRGDTLLVTRIDRLARSTTDLHRIVSELTKEGVLFKVIDQPTIETVTSSGKLMFAVLAAIAEFENDIRSERQMDGIQKAKEKGVKFGRKTLITDEVKSQVRLMRSEGKLVREIMKEIGLSKASVYRALK
uniref:Resolvase n=1 Tax=OCS116 cluster bacterium TaxID=2030921 RepID=A0A2A4YRJ8_9PROT